MRKSGCGIPLSRLSCFQIAEKEEKIWFARSEVNGLYEYDKKEKRAKLLMRFSDYAIDRNFLCLAIEKVGSILVLAPALASKIVLYDLMDEKAEYLELALVEGKRKVKYIGECRFLKSYRYGNSVYFFGFEYPAVLKIDVNTKQVIYLDDWVAEVERRIKKISVTMGYVSDYVVAGDCIWALCECADAVLRLDMRTDEIKVIDIYTDLDIRCGICFDGNFWVTGYNENANKLLKYDCSFVLEKEIEICSAPEDGDSHLLSLQDNLWEFYPILDMGDKLFLFSVYPRHVYEYDKTQNEVHILSAFEKLLEVQDEKLHDMGILAPRKKGNLIYFITGKDFLWNEYDFIHDTVTRYEVKAESDEEFLQIKLKDLAGRIISENEKMWNLGYKLTLSRFLEHITYVKAEADNMERDKSVGAMIHDKNSREVSAI